MKTVLNGPGRLSLSGKDTTIADVLWSDPLCVCVCRNTREEARGSLGIPLHTSSKYIVPHVPCNVHFDFLQSQLSCMHKQEVMMAM